MLNDLTGFKHIYIACGHTDLRLGIDGLATIVQQEFHLYTTAEGSIFLFCGRRNDRIKALLYEGLSAHFCYPNHFDKNPCILKFK